MADLGGFDAVEAIVCTTVECARNALAIPAAQRFTQHFGNPHLHDLLTLKRLE
jgi:hypothetical protein